MSNILLQVVGSINDKQNVNALCQQRQLIIRSRLQSNDRLRLYQCIARMFKLCFGVQLILHSVSTQVRTVPTLYLRHVMHK
jgi:hypothetical protein